MNIMQLHDLARLYGIEVAYTNAEHKAVHASPETLTAVLRALGVTVQTMMLPTPFANAAGSFGGCS